MRAVSGKERGFTLIEVMCATGILIMGMMGVYTAEIACARNYANSRQLFLATSLASNMMEMLKVMQPTAVQALKGSLRRNFDVNGKAVQGNQSSVFYQLSIAPSPGNGAQAFMVQVTWPDDSRPGKQASLQMSGTAL